MKGEPNQSSTRPRSSTTSREPRKVATKMNPIRSNSGALIGRLCAAYQQIDEGHGGDADWAVDEKVPLPGIVVGDPAAKRRPDDRRNDHGYTEQREGLAALLGREGIRQDGLRHRYHPPAAKPLQDAEKEQRLEVPCHAAEDGAQSE